MDEKTVADTGFLTEPDGKKSNTRLSVWVFFAASVIAMAIAEWQASDRLTDYSYTLLAGSVGMPTLRKLFEGGLINIGKKQP